jgi:hypothetical protein
MAEQPTQTPPPAPAPERITVKEFLEKVPPGREASIKGLAFRQYSTHGGGYSLLFQLPIIQLHCTTEYCNGIRFFEPGERNALRPGERTEHFVTYLCRNCRKTTKTYALWAYLEKEGIDGDLFKFGEFPAFGPPTPARVISIIGGEREYYLKGRRSENQGLGIAAFAYYRRVVENQKNKILDEILRVANKIGAPKEVIEDLNAAKNETQFSKAVAVVKHGIPQALLVNGHNPLTLLHSALSEGLHAQTDEECLELATSIRVILTDLVDRLANALKEEAELNAAVSKLLKASAAKSDNPKPDAPASDNRLDRH